MSSDPYRTLGLEPGASMAEVKRAYRRLAKAFHPDSAGEAALPRFLAVNEAYEAIRTGRPAPTARAAPATERAAEPWRADPGRARAARERAKTARSGRAWGTAAGSGSSASGRGSAAEGRSSSKSGTSGTSGTPGAESGGFTERGTAAGRSGRRRSTRKATLGSTSYDEARDATDATWSGASWYGPTTGEYWIINPREYADPRKHGPAYQSRARRAAAEGIDETGSPAPDLASGAAATAGAGATPPPVADDIPEAESETRATHETGRADDLRRQARPTPAPPWGRGQTESPRAPAGATWTRAEDDWDLRSANRRAPRGSMTREWLGGPTDDPIRRLGLALVAWPPLGLAAAAAIGDVTGCTTYSAECAGTDSLLPWLAQAAILGLLLLLPPLARLLAAGTVAIVLALLPVTAFLVVVGGSGQPEAGFALAFLLGVVWLVGVGWSLSMAARRRGSGSEGAA